MDTFKRNSSFSLRHRKMLRQKNFEKFWLFFFIFLIFINSWKKIIFENFRKKFFLFLKTEKFEKFLVNGKCGNVGKDEVNVWNIIFCVYFQTYRFFLPLKIFRFFTSENFSIFLPENFSIFLPLKIFRFFYFYFSIFLPLKIFSIFHFSADAKCSELLYFSFFCMKICLLTFLLLRRSSCGSWAIYGFPY